MSDPIHVAVIYKKNWKFLLKDYRDNTQHYFFMHALNRNKELSVEFFPSENEFDIKSLKNNFDIILLPDNSTINIPEKFLNIKESKIPVIARTGDPHTIFRDNRLDFHKSHRVKSYFGPMTTEYFHKFYPKNFNFKYILAGLEPQLYKKCKPFEERISDKILNSGNVGNSKLKSRIANAIINPKKSSWYFYKLRTKCNNLSYVDYSGFSNGKFINEDYPSYVSQYKSAIAASRFYAVIKYLELTSAGCLTFMEVSDDNLDAIKLGFIDGKNSIFINEKNYKNKFKEFLNDPENSDWKKIANAGRKHSLENLNNDVAVKILVKLIKETIDT